MANPEHLAIISQGVEVWNNWRMEHPDIEPDLRQAGTWGIDGNKRNEPRLNLTEINLSFADLSFSNLMGADLTQANLFRGRLIGANLSSANLYGANLSNTDLKKASFKSADLSYADLTGAILDDAIFKEAGLIEANFSNAVFSKTDFTQAWIGKTKFINNDLSATIGIETVNYGGPSDISINTLNLSRGKIPGVFLRGCGLHDWEIENAKLYDPNISNEEVTDIQYKVHHLRAQQLIQIKPLFISYSHNDSTFIDTFEKQLNQQGIRFWRDTHHATSGRLEKQINRAIILNDIMLLVLSEHSTNSDWVEHEARKAREKEKKTGKDALCPIALDDSWKTCRWPERLREQIMEYNILDFSMWQDQHQFERMFARLIDGLAIFYK